MSCSPRCLCSSSRFLSLTVGHGFHAVITLLTVVKRGPRGRGCDEDEGEGAGTRLATA